MFKRRLAKILVNIYTKLYRKCVMLEKGVKVLYVKLQKDIYGLLRSALLFYLKLVTDLKNNGFVINPYDLWVVNKIVRVGGYDSGMVCWRSKSVTQGTILSDQVCSILVDNIQEQTQGRYRKDIWLSRSGFLLFRDRVGKSFCDKIPTKGPRQVSRIVER